MALRYDLNRHEPSASLRTLEEAPLGTVMVIVTPRRALEPRLAPLREESVDHSAELEPLEFEAITREDAEWQ